jgi:hypothetical protein
MWTSKTSLHLALIGIDEEENCSAIEFVKRQLGPLLVYLLRRTSVSNLCVHAAGPCNKWPDATTQIGCQISPDNHSITGRLINVDFDSPDIQCGNAIQALPEFSEICPTVIRSAAAIAQRQLTVSITSRKVSWEKYDAQWRKATLPALESESTTALMLLPNAGLWGYDSWEPALNAIMEPSAGTQHLIVTSYTVAEAEDDEEVLRSARRATENDTACFLWEPRRSPWGCIHLADDQYKIANSFAWQAVSL